MTNKVLDSFLSGQKTIGTFMNFGSPTVAEVLGIAGLDYFIVDTEHSPFGLDETLQCVRSAQIYGITPFARISHINRGNILKMLDIGVQGLIVPGIRHMEEIDRLIELGKYTPLGNRGFCPTRCCTYGYGSEFSQGIKAYTEECNRRTMLIPQCETVECLEMIEDVVNRDGVDGIFIGPFDLSLDMGIPAQFEDERFKAAVERILKACKAAHKWSCIFAPDLSSAQLRLEQGFDSITYTADLNRLTDAFASDMKILRQ